LAPDISKQKRGVKRVEIGWDLYQIGHRCIRRVFQRGSWGMMGDTLLKVLQKVWGGLEEQIIRLTIK